MSVSGQTYLNNRFPGPPPQIMVEVWARNLIQNVYPQVILIQDVITYIIGVSDLQSYLMGPTQEVTH